MTAALAGPLVGALLIPPSQKQWMAKRAKMARRMRRLRKQRRNLLEAAQWHNVSTLSVGRWTLSGGSHWAVLMDYHLAGQMILNNRLSHNTTRTLVDIQ